MNSVRKMISATVAGLALAASMPALAGTATSAQGLAQGLRSAKAVVDQAISGAGGSIAGSIGGSTGGGTGGGTNPWGEASDVVGGGVNESDALGLPILIQASTSLGQAAQDADEANFAFITGNIAFGDFRFSEACSTMGISRSQLSRANTAALLPPAGFLAAFGPDLTNVLVELLSLKATEGCP